MIVSLMLGTTLSNQLCISSRATYCSEASSKTQSRMGMAWQ